MNKRGQITELADNFIELFSSIILVLVVGAAALIIYTNTIGLAGFSSSNVQGALGFLNSYHTFIDWGILLIFGGLAIGSIIRSMAIELTPPKYVLSWLIMVVFSFFFLIFGWVIQSLTNNTFFAAIINKMAFISFFAGNSFIFVTLYFFISLVALHSPK